MQNLKNYSSVIYQVLMKLQLTPRKTSVSALFSGVVSDHLGSALEWHSRGRLTVEYVVTKK
jgi:hypothetical protein